MQLSTAMLWWTVSIQIVFVLQIVSGPLFANLPSDSCLFTLRRTSLPFSSPILNSTSRNQHFVDFIKGPLPERMLFLHIENAVLKSLNDKILADKSKSAELQELFANLFLTNLVNDGLPPPKAIYTDYKSIRLAFTDDSSALRDKMIRTYRRTAHQFEALVRERADIAPKLVGQAALLAYPHRWNQAGFGSTADGAAGASRFGRYRPEDPKVYHFDSDTVQNEIHQHFLDAAKKAAAIELEFKSLHDLPEAILTSRYGEESLSLSPSVISLFKTVKATSKAEYISAIRSRFERRFGVRLTDRQIELIQSYLHLLETFSPAIFEVADTKDLGIETARHGIVAVDLAGQNVRNLISVQNAIQKSKPHYQERSDLPMLMKNIRVGQEEASLNFEKMRHNLILQIHRLGVPGEIRHSGDDIIFAPFRPLTPSEKTILLSHLTQALGPGLARLTVTDSDYFDSHQSIPAKQRGEFLGQGEIFEKQLREALEASGIPLAMIRQFSFGVTVKPRENGPPSFELLIHPTPRPELEAKMRATAAKISP